ncbi:tautomerase family protein [Bradyrhizobium sp. Ai1a-2]|uniref:tautomerase family protein n=1 Tax=Bradyrhizobium sp. Ai1a-2 TaxID=196490 RepID=UPI0003FC2BDA|nr:tautomerase family protein [Bradyrhizobium sp. Ai1a-2]
MPVAKFHVHQGRYDSERLDRLGKAVQAALESVLKIPPEDYYRVFYELPPQRFVHTPGFLGLEYSKDFVLLELTFISGRSSDTRLALLKEINSRAVEATGISPDDMVVLIYELPGENISFGQGLAQRAHISHTASS